MQVDHNGQIQPALCCPDVADVARPFLVWKIDSEVTIQRVRRYIEAVMAIGRGLVFVSSDHVNAVIAHQSANTAMTNGQTQLLSSCVILGLP